MKKFEWNALKNASLKQTRGVSFEDILKQELVTILIHPIKNNQKILVFKYKDYCWAVPCVSDEHKIFLKTIYPSRKLSKKYLGKE